MTVKREEKRKMKAERMFLINVICGILMLTATDVSAALVNKPDCELLGYTTPHQECLDVGGTPLFCPFYTTEQPMTLCLGRSCRGYPLTDADLNSYASDGRKVTEHIEELEECTTGAASDKETFYKVVRCKTGSLYQNNTCDVGCLPERYPYDEHQGNFAGDMRKCEDNVGTGSHYGYETCHDGWEGGWLLHHTGKCTLAECEIKDYPYNNDPNLSVNRGITQTCRVGGNVYYRYSPTDHLGAPSDQACGVANDYTLVNAVCQKQCVFSDCSATVINETLGGYAFSYNDWKCRLETPDCRIGDEAVINGVVAGIISHFPDDSHDHVKIFANYNTIAQISTAVHAAELTPISTANYSTYPSGKYNCKFLLAYAAEKNKTLTPENYYQYPAVEETDAYDTDDCSGACGVGEWFIASTSELKQIYQNHYLLYNVSKNVLGEDFINRSYTSVSFSDTGNCYTIDFSGGINTNASSILAKGSCSSTTTRK